MYTQPCLGQIWFSIRQPNKFQCKLQPSQHYLEIDSSSAKLFPSTGTDPSPQTSFRFFFQSAELVAGCKSWGTSWNPAILYHTEYSLEKYDFSQTKNLARVDGKERLKQNISK